ncbi:unnamed protein product [Prunus armeniaca]|uniref:Uncharacterized protein n=1 Tax=Prunus armeniaca TaxID=36596 RepID=A0A6J5VCP0_PRUAR|nr:unnamed protein product [Prunus armeniaca]
MPSIKRSALWWENAHQKLPIWCRGLQPLILQQAAWMPPKAAYKKVFKGCPFRRELGKRENQALLAQLAEDNKLPMTVATSHKTFRPFKELATEKGKATGEGSGFAGPKVLIFVQRKRNLVKTAPSPSLVAKVTSPSKTSKLDSIVPLSPTSSGRVEKLGARKRSLLEESFPCPPLALVLPPSPNPNAGEVLQGGARAGEVKPPSEGARAGTSTSINVPRTKPQLQDEVACLLVSGLFDRLRGFFPNSTPQPQEPVGEDGEHATDVVNPELSCNSNVFMVQVREEPEPVDAPQPQGCEPETAAPTPPPETSSVPMEGVEANVPRYENVVNAFMSKEKGKVVMEGWLLLSLDEKISERQCTKVLRALDDPSFAASFESA